MVSGEKGTAKFTAFRFRVAVLPDMSGGGELPISVTEERVVGTLDIEYAMRHGERKFEPGILAEADGNILYVDEVSFLDDHMVDGLLNAAVRISIRLQVDGHRADIAMIKTAMTHAIWQGWREVKAELVTYTFLYAHLLDQLDWGLLKPLEAAEAGERLLSMMGLSGQENRGAEEPEDSERCIRRMQEYYLKGLASRVRETL